MAHDQVRILALKHRRWVVWYGEHTKRYWGLPCWPEAAHALVEAATPEEFSYRAGAVERRYPPGAGG